MKLLIVLTVYIHLVLSKPGGRIINGELAEEDQFPFAAVIYATKFGETYLYGGALINKQWVVTSGHCAQNASSFEIKLGSNTLTGDNSNQVTLKTGVYIVHPQYRSETFENNIALIQFRLPITFNQHIQSINLPISPIEVNSPVTAIGWGSQTDASMEANDALRWVTLSTLSNSECEETYSDLADDVLCAAGNFDQGICVGDLGGPLILYVGGTATLAGIASFYSADGCGNADPSGFTQVYSHLDWIKHNTEH